MQILLIEDDDVLRDMTTRSLVERGHAVKAASSIAGGGQLWRTGHYDAVVLDLTLPRTSIRRSGLGSGLTLLAAARARGDRTPVLVLSARHRTEERIAGLDAGADDYMGKPFDVAEVEARLRSLERRARGSCDRTEVGGLLLDRHARRFFVAGEPLDLPAREFEVLWELMTPPGRVVSKREFAGKLSDPMEPLGDNAVEFFVSSLRKRMDLSGVKIRTLRGIGYLLEEELASAPSR